MPSRSVRSLFLSVLLLAPLGACGRGEAPAASPAPAVEHAALPARPAAPRPKGGAAVAGMDEALSAYLAQGEALAQDRFDAARAGAVADALGKVEAGQGGDWLEGLRQAAKGYADSKDLAQARQAYGTLSDRMIAYVEAHDTAVADLHKVRCPMAPEGIEGSWLQTGLEVRNPWYGSGMLRCGVAKW
jgi:Cu(I)/Ag(I) efflux system membrane fusion protein